MKKLFFAFMCLLASNILLKAEGEIDSTTLFIQQVEGSLRYQTGKINLKGGLGVLTVPQGFKYLDPEQSMYVLSDLWGNPKDSTTLGLLVPENKGVLGDNVWVFEINYDPMGFVKDDDADDIDYDDLLVDLQKETNEANTIRVQEGYPAITLVGWASKPYYDEDKKVLHWAKELKFGKDSTNTLNYNLRVLGRKGVFIINAIAGMQSLPEVNANVDKVITSVEFTEGNKYSDFDPDLDEVAAWTVGGLVAGKVLAKVGLFALLAKSWKLIAIGLMAAGSFVVNLFRKKKKEEPKQDLSNENESQA